MFEFSRRENLKGWIPGNLGSDTGVLAEEIARLTKENFDLRNRLNEANANEPTYNSLTFSQIEILLKKIEVDNLSGIKNLWEFFLANADAILDHKEVLQNTSEEMALRKLVTLGIVEYADNLHWDPLPPDVDAFKFSNEGHKFYLMALVRQATTL
jgi:hypothetical protein